MSAKSLESLYITIIAILITVSKMRYFFVLETAMIFSVALFGSPIGLSSTVAAVLLGSDQM